MRSSLRSHVMTTPAAGSPAPPPLSMDRSIDRSTESPSGWDAGCVVCLGVMGLACCCLLSDLMGNKPYPIPTGEPSPSLATPSSLSRFYRRHVLCPGVWSGGCVTDHPTGKKKRKVRAALIRKAAEGPTRGICYIFVA